MPKLAGVINIKEHNIRAEDLPRTGSFRKWYEVVFKLLRIRAHPPIRRKSLGILKNCRVFMQKDTAHLNIGLLSVLLTLPEVGDFFTYPSWDINSTYRHTRRINLSR